MTTVHRRWGRLVEACLDGSLPEGAEPGVRRHLQRCRVCEEHAAFLLGVRASLRRIEHRLPALSLTRLERLAGSLRRAPGRQPEAGGFPAHGP